MCSQRPSRRQTRTRRQIRNPRPAVLIIDERSKSELLGFYCHPVRPGGIVTFSTELDITVDFFEGSPLAGPNPLVIAKGTTVNVEVSPRAEPKTYPCRFVARGHVIAQMRVKVSAKGMKHNGFKVLRSEFPRVALDVSCLLDREDRLAVRFLNISNSDVSLTLSRPGGPEVSLEIPGSSEQLFRFTPNERVGTVASISMRAEPQPPGSKLETGGTEQADLIIEPPT